jgi:hypothetical protein
LLYSLILSFFRRFKRSGILRVLALSLLFGSGRMPPAIASLRVIGDSPHASLWRRLYDRMPQTWRTRRVVVVREVSDREMDEQVAEDMNAQANDGSDDDSVVDGYYQNGHGDQSEAPTITLRRTMDDEEAAFVFTHEYGHFVWYKILTSRQRADYARLWKQQKRNGRLVTEYAADSEEEGFAEAFAHFLQKPVRLRNRDLDSWRFLDRLVNPPER